jgi:hypothetical protein
MSLFSSVANYGGKQPDNSQGIKQFVQSPGGQAVWIYKRLPSGIQVQTPADKIRPVYINSDLYVNGSIFNPSDYILKKDIQSISREKADSLIDLNAVSFKFKDERLLRINCSGKERLRSTSSFGNSLPKAFK